MVQKLNKSFDRTVERMVENLNESRQSPDSADVRDRESTSTQGRNRDLEKSGALGYLMLFLFIPAALIFGLFKGSDINYRERIADMVMCDELSEETLSSFGYSSEDKRAECQALNEALMRQAVNECGDLIADFGDLGAIGEKRYSELVDRCVYHTLSNQIQLPHTVTRISQESR